MSSDSIAAYESLARLIDEDVTSIELLPGSSASWPSADPWLVHKTHVGVPTKDMYSAYLAALRVFADACTPLNLCDTNERPKLELRRATGVIALANPAHLTSLNARRRVTLPQERDRELRVTAALLRTLAGARAEALWAYRRAILGDQGFDMDAELTLVERACELSPRNYYAWRHRAWCAERTDARVEKVRVLKWVDGHVADYSAMHHLCRLGGEGTLEHALELLERYPAHEALWMYVRVAAGGTEGRRRAEGTVRSIEVRCEEQKEWVGDENLMVRRCAAAWRGWYALMDGKMEDGPAFFENLREMQ